MKKSKLCLTSSKNHINHGKETCLIYCQAVWDHGKPMKTK